MRETGHEHFNGSVVIPIIAPSGEITEVYGRKITERLAARHAESPVPAGSRIGACGTKRRSPNTSGNHPLRGADRCADLLVCRVSQRHGKLRHRGLYRRSPTAFKAHGTTRVLIAYDRDEAGDRAAEKLASQLTAAGLDAYRIQFPKGMDANEYALKVTPAAKSLGLVIRKAQWLGKGEAPTSRISSVATPTVPVMTEEAAKEEIPAPAADRAGRRVPPIRYRGCGRHPAGLAPAGAGRRRHRGAGAR